MNIAIALTYFKDARSDESKFQKKLNIFYDLGVLFYFYVTYMYAAARIMGQGRITLRHDG